MQVLVAESALQFIGQSVDVDALAADDAARPFSLYAHVRPKRGALDTQPAEASTVDLFADEFVD